MLFRVLGPLTAVNDPESPVEISRKKQRTLLGLLLLHANTAPSYGYIIEQLWHGRPPRSAHSNLKSYISQLRRLLHTEGSPSPIITSGSGYLIAVTEKELDALTFEDLAANGRTRLATGGLSRACDAFETALGLWRGEALHGIELGGDLARWAERLREERLSVTEDLFDAKLRLGRHSEIIGHLRALAAKHRLREHLHVQLMLALYRSGRQAEALDTYRALRSALVAQVGAEPGVTAQNLHRRILTADPTLVSEPMVSEILERVRTVLTMVNRSGAR